MAKLKFSDVIEDYNKKHKSTLITDGLPKYDYDKIPFSSPRMNYCTHGGIPQGHAIEFYGQQYGGKTTTALDIVANYQKIKNHKKILYCDVENGIDRVWATKLGVDLSEDAITILNSIEESAEEIFQLICDAIKTDEVGLVIIDSLAAMVSKQAREKELTEKTYGGISIALTNFADRVIGLCRVHNCTIIGINQVRDVINSQFPLTNTPGGRAWKHICSLRIEFRQGQYIDEDGHELKQSCENPAGSIIQMNISKTRVFPPDRKVGSYTVKYNGKGAGVDYIRDLFELAITMGGINQRGAYFDILDLDTGEVINTCQGAGNTIQYLTENKKVKDKLEKQVLAKMEEE